MKAQVTMVLSPPSIIVKVKNFIEEMRGSES
jgi:hypothetical protein